MLSPQQFPYTGPYSLPTGSHRSRGPTALALKRMCKRFGSGFQDKEFSELDEHYNEALEAALDKAIPGMDGYGEKRWEAARALKVPKGRPNAGQYALDDFAQQLVRDEAKAQPSPASKIDEVRKFITEFCKKGLANTSAWNYSQNRPVDVSVDPSGSSIRSDCSGSVIQAVHYAKRKTELAVQDPSKQNWSGYGNCCDPAARTLTTDLRWVPLGDVKVGDELWALDEEVTTSGGKGRKYRRTVVTESFLTQKECVRLHFDDGTAVICSTDHPWLVNSGRSGNWFWRKADDLFPYQLASSRLACRPFKPWTWQQNYETGWLAGIFDGEGHISYRGSRQGHPHVLGITQSVGSTADRIVQRAQRYGSFAVAERPATEALPNAKTRLELTSNGMGLAGVLDFLGTIRPERLIDNLDLEGVSVQGRERVEIVALESIGAHEVQSLTTSQHTYFVEGFAVHNTDLYEDDWPTVSGSYQVGDLAHYQGHVTLCIKAGDWNSSEWWSFGSEPPSKRKLNYRSDFRKVVRPVYLA